MTIHLGWSFVGWCLLVLAMTLTWRVCQEVEGGTRRYLVIACLVAFALGVMG